MIFLIRYQYQYFYATTDLDSGQPIRTIKLADNYVLLLADIAN